MNKYKDSEEPKVPEYELVVFSDHLYILYTYYEVGVKIFKTRSKVRMKMQLDLLGIGHFDEVHMHHRYVDSNPTHSHFSPLKYE